MAPEARFSVFIPVVTIVFMFMFTVAACDSRAVPDDSDGATSPLPDGPFTSPPPDGDIFKLDASIDTRVVPDASVPTSCQQLYLVNKVMLDQMVASSADKPDVVHDGKGHFGVVWISKPLPGAGSDPDAGPTLRFARVSHSGKAANPQGVQLASADLSFHPELQLDVNHFMVLYNAAPGGTTLAHFDDQGVISSKSSGIGTLTHATATLHPKGYTVLYVNPFITELKIAQYAYGGPLYFDKLVHDGEPYWYLWLTPRKSGYAATWGKRFARLDHLGVLQEQPKTAIAQDFVSASSWVPLADGTYAVAYARASDSLVELLRLDAAGKPLGPPVPVDHANISSAPIKQLSLLWTGSRFIVVYPAKVSSSAQAQLLDPLGKKVGKPVKLPQCLSWSMLAGAAAWGGGRLAVATVDGLSGPPWGGICVSVLACK